MTFSMDASLGIEPGPNRLMRPMSRHVNSQLFLVDLVGIEPTTYGLQSRRSPS